MLLVERLTWNRWTMHCFQLLKRSMYHPSIHMWSSKCLLAILFFPNGRILGRKWAMFGNIQKCASASDMAALKHGWSLCYSTNAHGPCLFPFHIGYRKWWSIIYPQCFPMVENPPKWWPLRVARNSKSPLQYVRYLMMLFTRLWIYLILLIWNIAYVTYRIKVTNCIYVFVYIGMWLKKGL